MMSRNETSAPTPKRSTSEKYDTRCVCGHRFAEHSQEYAPGGGFCMYRGGCDCGRFRERFGERND